MRRLRALLLSAFATVEPERVGQQTFLMRAVFADGRLWILSDAGRLSNIAEGETIRVEEPLADPVLDLCLWDGHPTVITDHRDESGPWTLRQRMGSDWAVLSNVARDHDRFVALSCTAGNPIILTDRRVIEVAGHQHRAVGLSEELRSGLIATVFSTPAHVFVGINAGEWGGGLRRIDRHTGKVSLVVGNPDDLRGGSIPNDPITAIAPIPWNAGCVAVAVGLVHFVPSGRIMEVCGDDVRRLYFKGLALPADEGKAGEPFTSVAFFGLISLGDALWAVGLDGIYRLERGGAVHSVPLPEFTEVDGIRVSFDLPQFVVVMTDINQRRSISGSVPLLVPR